MKMASLFNSMTARILICLEISLFMTSIMAFDHSTKRFCGRALTESLALICDGEYETIIPTEIKRSGLDESFDEYAYNDQAAAVMDDLPIQYQTYAYLSKLFPESVNMRPRTRREWMQVRVGVYDECCRKPCSYHELKSYCKRKN